jgi:hypothetical protein
MDSDMNRTLSQDFSGDMRGNALQDLHYNTEEGHEVSGSKNLNKRVLAVGHSHLGALEFFASLNNPMHDFQIEFMQLLSEEFAYSTGPDAEVRLIQTLRKKAAQCDLAILCISGNEHQMIGLINHPRAFDFVSPLEPDLPLLVNREIVPGDIIRDALASMIRGDLFRTIAENLSIPKYQLEPPPPILDHAHITTYAGVFKEKIAELGINDPGVRLKLWRLCSHLTRSVCERHSIGYVPAPIAAVGPEGYLHCDALSPDPTHANAWYGGLIMSQIEELFVRRAANG